MALTAAQFFGFLGPRNHELRWTAPVAGAEPVDGTLTLNLEVRKTATGLSAWMTWKQTGPDYQTALLGLAESVKNDVQALGAS